MAPTLTRQAGRPREFDPEQALDRAIAVFTERGYHAASIAELSSAMGLTAGSIYKAFGDKRAIFLAALDRHKMLGDAKKAARLDEAGNGRDRVRALLAYYAENASGASGARGCLMISTAIELSLFDAEIGQSVSQNQHRTRDMLESFIRQGQSDGSINQHVDPKTCANIFFCFTQGIRVAGKTGQDKADALAAADAILKLLD